MDTIAFWIAVIGYLAVWCGLFSPLTWLIRTVWRVPNDRAERVAFSVCYIGAVLVMMGPLMVIMASNPFLRFPAEVLAGSHERCSTSWCSKLLAVVERPG